MSLIAYSDDEDSQDTSLIIATSPPESETYQFGVITPLPNPAGQVQITNFNKDSFSKLYYADLKRQRKRLASTITATSEHVPLVPESSASPTTQPIIRSTKILPVRPTSLFHDVSLTDYLGRCWVSLDLPTTSQEEIIPSSLKYTLSLDSDFTAHGFLFFPSGSHVLIVGTYTAFIYRLDFLIGMGDHPIKMMTFNLPFAISNFNVSEFLIAFSSFSTVVVFDLRTGDVIFENNFDANISNISFSAISDLAETNQNLIVCLGNLIEFWDIDSKRKVAHSVEELSSSVTSFSHLIPSFSSTISRPELYIMTTESGLLSWRIPDQPHSLRTINTSSFSKWIVNVLLENLHKCLKRKLN
ncbi:hypothetical protein RCL1_000884 [Eukaryota sp. TZLM3-RCL]